MRRAVDILDGFPDRLEVGDTPLMMKLMLNPDAERFGREDYSLYRAVVGRADKAAGDLRTRAEHAGIGVNAETLRLMEEEKARVRAGGGDPDKDPKYRDPMIWEYLRERKAKLEEKAAEKGVTIDEYLVRHPEMADPEVELIESGIRAELAARLDLHNAWADRMVTAGTVDVKGGASGLFINPNRAELKSADWVALFRDKEMADREDEALRAMVDAALGTEKKWENKGDPHDARKTETLMWKVMLKRRMKKDPRVADQVDAVPGGTLEEKKAYLNGKQREVAQAKERYEQRLKGASESLDRGHRRIGEARARPDMVRLQGDIKVMEEEARLLKQFEWKNPYPTTMSDNIQFKEWFDYVLDRAGGDSRAVFLAWRKFQLWEVISRVDIGSVMGAEGPIIIDPPVGNDLAAQHYGFQRKRQKEYGRVADGDGFTDLRGSRSRYAAGPPVTIEQVDHLGLPFLDHARVPVEGEPGKRTLWQVWYERGTSLGELPWMATEDPKEWSGVTDEVAPNSYTGWLYQRLNAETVRKWMLMWNVSVAQLHSVDDSGRQVIQTIAKAFDKSMGEMEYDPFKRALKRSDGEVVYEPFTQEAMRDPRMKGRINPRAIWIMGMITQKHFNRIEDKVLGDDPRRVQLVEDISPLGIGSGDFGFTTVNALDPKTAMDKGVSPKRRMESITFLMALCVGNGLIDEKEKKEILAFCKVPPQLG